MMETEEGNCKICDGTGELLAHTLRQGCGCTEYVACPLCMQVEKDAEIASLRAEVIDREAEITRLRAYNEGLAKIGAETEAELERLREQNEKMAEALAPFAAIRGLLKIAGDAIPDDASASRLKLDGLLASHFKAAHGAIARPASASARSEWDDLRGAAPNATGNLSSEDFVRKLRDEWRDPGSAEGEGA
jgi:hypothetical protein